jgi:hypothetical protein
MPQFKAGAKQAGEHLKSHKAIHDGELPIHLSTPKQADRKVWTNMTNSWKMYRKLHRAITQISWGVYWIVSETFFLGKPSCPGIKLTERHLDEEVEDIGGESLRKAGFTLKEIKQIPM